MRLFAIFLSMAMSFFSNSLFGAATKLLPGDIAIIGFNFQDPDQFSFINFVPLEAGTEIHFTDCGWKASGSFREGEGIVTYKVPSSGLAIGTIITFPNDPGFSKKGVNGFFGFNATGGEQILVYQGDFTNPAFIFGVNSNPTNGWDADAINNNTSALPAGLTDGVNAIALNNYKNAYYNCSVEGGKIRLLESIMQKSNWVPSSSRVDLPLPCDFKLSLVVRDFYADEHNGYAAIYFKIPNFNQIASIYLEKSSDGIFNEIRQFNPKGIEEFHHTDLEFEKDSYYRIKIIDDNGQIALLQPIFLAKKAISKFTLYRNGEDQLKIASNERILELTILSSTGSVIEKMLNPENNEAIEQIINKLPQGGYLIHYLLENRAESIPFIK